MTASPESLQKEKAALRRLMLAKRHQLAKTTCTKASFEAGDIFFRHIPLPKSTVIAGYISMGNELSCHGILQHLHQQGHTLCLPAMEKDSPVLRFFRWTPKEPLRLNAMGWHAPKDTTHAINPDMTLVPLVAFDKYGARLGRGKGYYDATLAQSKKLSPAHRAIGLAYTIQKVACVPCEKHDMLLDGVVTEDKFFSVR